MQVVDGAAALTREAEVIADNDMPHAEGLPEQALHELIRFEARYRGR